MLLSSASGLDELRDKAKCVVAISDRCHKIMATFAQPPMEGRQVLNSLMSRAQLEKGATFVQLYWICEKVV